MDYLQYVNVAEVLIETAGEGFKPCYKWITFNTLNIALTFFVSIVKVLNLVINGLPSILKLKIMLEKENMKF